MWDGVKGRVFALCLPWNWANPPWSDTRQRRLLMTKLRNWLFFNIIYNQFNTLLLFLTLRNTPCEIVHSLVPSRFRSTSTPQSSTQSLVIATSTITIHYYLSNEGMSKWINILNLILISFRTGLEVETSWTATAVVRHRKDKLIISFPLYVYILCLTTLQHTTYILIITR